MKTLMQKTIERLDFYGENLQEDWEDKELDSVFEGCKKILTAGSCECDSYNGFDCGCGKIAWLLQEVEAELKARKEKP